MMISGEMFIELGDSWFIAKTMVVVISLISFISIVQNYDFISDKDK